MITIRDKLFSLIKKHENNIIFVSYPKGYGGHLVTRIISASPEIYFESDSIKYPDDCEGFPSVFDKYIDIHQFKAQHLCTVDCNRGNFPFFREARLEKVIEEKYNNPEAKKIMNSNLNYFLNNLDKNRLFCVPTHEENIHEEFDGKVVRIVGDIDRHLLFSKPRPSLQPVYQENVINLELNKLISDNYKEYEDEYLQLCFSLNIFPQINSVRAFILLWTEKQRRYFLH
jgi:hypothetical protein